MVRDLLLFLSTIRSIRTASAGLATAFGTDAYPDLHTKTAALLQTYPDLKGIISPTTVGISAAARYLQTSEFKGKVALTGLGTPNQMRDYVEDGTVTLVGATTENPSFELNGALLSRARVYRLRP